MMEILGAFERASSNELGGDSIVCESDKESERGPVCTGSQRAQCAVVLVPKNVNLAAEAVYFSRDTVHAACVRPPRTGGAVSLDLVVLDVVWWASGLGIGFWLRGVQPRTTVRWLRGTCRSANPRN